MSAPMEQRPEDVMQAALAAEDQHYQDLFGPPTTWSPVVWGQYFTDLHIARQRAMNWEAAA